MLSNIEEREVLIIEDSPAVGILLKEFLTKLGFKKIHHCQNGKSGIAFFKDMVEQGRIPLVFLDYNLPDMNAHSIMSQLLEIRPDVKVIIETAREMSEEPIKDVIAQGAYQYLGKPIRLEKLKNIIDTLRFEETHFVDEDEVSRIENIVSNTTQISLLRLAQHVNKTMDDVLPMINQMLAKKKLIKINDIREIICLRCNSVRVAQIFNCPKCKGVNFKQDKVIEHYKCGNVSIASSYVNEKCPKCHEQIKVFGVDYRAQDNYYLCNDCGESFAEILISYLCLKCNNRFSLENAKTVSSAGYSYLNSST